MPHGFLIICIYLLSLFPSAVFGQSAPTSKPQGIYTVRIAGKPEGKTQARTYLGIPLRPATWFSGIVAEVTENSFSFNNPPVNPNQADREFYVHVLDGPGKGFIGEIEEFRASDILCKIPLQAWMQAGTRVVIRPQLNVSDIFGAQNQFGLTSGESAEIADNLVLWDPLAQRERVYYFHLARNRWEEAGIAADAGNTQIRFPNGLYIIRRTARNLRMTLSGFPSADPVLLPVRQGANVLSLPLNLSSSVDNLITSAGNFPVISGVNSSQADILTFEEPSGTRRGPFYHSSRPSSIKWREIGKNASDEVIQPMDPLSTLILRREGGEGFVLAEGDLSTTGPTFTLPSDPEIGESPLMGELPRITVPSGFSMTVETSSDLQNWTAFANPIIDGNVVRFTLPAGQSRGFYRVSVSPNR